jgi:hypothetical protein
VIASKVWIRGLDAGQKRRHVLDVSGVFLIEHDLQSRLLQRRHCRLAELDAERGLSHADRNALAAERFDQVRHLGTPHIGKRLGEEHVF